MNKHELQGELKSTTTAYVLFVFLLAHYAYLGKWGKQILFWITLGGLGIWALVDLFTIPEKVRSYNRPIYQKMDHLEKEEKEEAHARNIAIASAAIKGQS